MKLLLTGSFNYTDDRLRFLKNIGWDITVCEREDSALPSEAYEADAVVCNWLFVYHDIKLFIKLKYVQLLSAGLDRISLDYVNDNNIKVNTARGVYSIPIAEFAISGVLQLYKHANVFYDRKKEHLWEKSRDLKEMSDNNVLIVGTGSIGTEVAKRFSPFVNGIDGICKQPRRIQFFDNIFSVDKLEILIEKYDIVIICLPLVSETKGLFSSKLLHKMKKDSVIVNISRGGIIDEHALLDLLKTHLYGAVLDVFEEEPLDECSEFWNLDNVIITPHNSFVSNRNDERMWTVIKTFLTQVTDRD